MRDENCLEDGCPAAATTMFDFGVDIQVEDHITHGYGFTGRFCTLHARQKLTKYYETIIEKIAGNPI